MRYIEPLQSKSYCSGSIYAAPTTLVKTLKQQESELKKQYKLKSIGIFGSYRRKEQKKKSDLDILVEFKDAPGLLKYMEIEGYLLRSFRKTLRRNMR